MLYDQERKDRTYSGAASLCLGVLAFGGVQCLQMLPKWDGRNLLISERACLSGLSPVCKILKFSGCTAPVRDDYGFGQSLSDMCHASECLGVWKYRQSYNIGRGAPKTAEVLKQVIIGGTISLGWNSSARAVKSRKPISFISKYTNIDQWQRAKTSVSQRRGHRKRCETFFGWS